MSPTPSGHFRDRLGFCGCVRGNLRDLGMRQRGLSGVETEFLLIPACGCYGDCLVQGAPVSQFNKTGPRPLPGLCVYGTGSVFIPLPLDVSLCPPLTFPGDPQLKLQMWLQSIPTRCSFTMTRSWQWSWRRLPVSEAASAFPGTVIRCAHAAPQSPKVSPAVP